jgi:hypothetical protein
MKVASFVGVLVAALVAFVSANPVPSTTVVATTTVTSTPGTTPSPPVSENDLFVPVLPDSLPWPGDAVDSLGAVNVTTACNATVVGCEEAWALYAANFNNNTIPPESLAGCVKILQDCPAIVPDTSALESRGEDMDCSWCDAYFDGCGIAYGLNYTWPSSAPALDKNLATFDNDRAISQCRLSTCASSLFSGFCGNYCGYAHPECNCHSPACNQVPVQGKMGSFVPVGSSSTIYPLPLDEWRTFSRDPDGTWYLVGTPSFTPPAVTLTSTVTSTAPSGVVTLTITSTWSWPTPEPFAGEAPTTTPTTTSPLGQPVRRSTTILDPFSVTDAAESSLLAEEYSAWSSSVAASIAAAQVTPN